MTRVAPFLLRKKTRQKRYTGIQIPVGAPIFSIRDNMRKPRFDAWKKIAKERIEILSELARQQPAYAKRYKEIIAKISKKYKIKVQEAR